MPCISFDLQGISAVCFKLAEREGFVTLSGTRIHTTFPTLEEFG